MIADPRSSLAALAKALADVHLEIAQHDNQPWTREVLAVVKAIAQQLAALASSNEAVILEELDELWVPSAVNVNALPEPIRRYVHDLETRCDPAGDVRELTIARDTIRQLDAALAAQSAPSEQPAADLAAALARVEQETAPTLQQAFDTLPKAWEPAPGGTPLEARADYSHRLIELSDRYRRGYGDISEMVKLFEDFAIAKYYDVHAAQGAGEARLRELARIEAERQHDEAFRLAWSPLPEGCWCGEHRVPFASCPHANCVLVRAGLVPGEKEQT